MSDDRDYNDWGYDNSTSFDATFWPTSVGKAVFAGVAIVAITLLNTLVVTKASKDEEPSSFVRLVRILGTSNLCCIPVWFLGLFLINISPEYNSTLFPFIYSYFLGPAETFLFLFITATVVLAGVDRVLVSKKSVFDSVRLNLVVVPLLLIVALVYFFRSSPEAVDDKLYPGDTQQRYILDFSWSFFVSDLCYYLDTLVFPLLTSAALIILLVWVWRIKRNKNEYTDNEGCDCWEEKVFIVMGLVTIVPSIQRVVDIFIYIIPFNMFVYLGLALSQNVAAFPYLIWG